MRGVYNLMSVAGICLLSAVCFVTLSFVTPSLAADPAVPPAQEAAERLELNAATVDQLTALPGGILTKEDAMKMVTLREQLGNFQAYEDLKELGFSDEKIDKLRPLTTVNYMATDCNC
ncbi:MAG: helix-hairpin-helix domain-containing protein [Desulfovibrio sp.]|jgi:competence protein ComEA|nr:helix-hairpin-helix domain-containing protein [Desulfovibrio sp.]